MSALAGPALAVPADPNRPLAAQTCAEAQARLDEAREGSPLLSPEEQAEVLRTALADAERLCGDVQRDGAVQDPALPTPATILLQNLPTQGKVLPLLAGIPSTFTASATRPDVVAN
ncbi:hypothetical protein KUL25_08235 [Rhodobacteraceae bacterium N5(2021)]|uniref:Uncharacterized protein n=1 Tax=Gymnodinialimonas phycosphaerae TaxID=2841589 RepID=A0A975TXE6_9RHOB|nr:hypothetical protein [Gymnodinialimonas phycosphaerae]MBY4892750.1 hypothetical protein [Gymnodinialimonas phycosphaerae]